jgi:DNA-binding MarR family transcriptional regulator
MAEPAFREISLLIAQMRRLCSVSVNKRLAVIGTSLASYKVLFHLVHVHEALQHELAEEAAMDPAAISRLIGGMVRDGYVTTRVDPADKRKRFVKLTRKGRELERSLSPVVDAAFEPFSACLSDKEQQQLVAILRKACEGVSQVAQAEGAESRSEPPLRARRTAPR